MRTVKPIPAPQDPFITDRATLGRFIRAARTQQGLSLQDAAVALTMAKQTLQNLERGEGNVSLTAALQALHGFGVALCAVPASRRRDVAQLMEATDNDRS